MKGYCPHFDEVMDLEDCFFCYFKKVKKEAENKIIPKDATLYCFYCLREEPVTEGELKDGILPIFCNVCKKQISELIATPEGWKLHPCFYKKLAEQNVREKTPNEKIN